MSLYEFERIVNTARGYYQLGMGEDAWSALENLQRSDRCLHPEVIALRLLILALMKRWDCGGALVDSITGDHHIDCRAAAGAYLLAHASALCDIGAHDAARRSVRRAAELYPEGRNSRLTPR